MPKTPLWFMRYTEGFFSRQIVRPVKEGVVIYWQRSKRTRGGVTIREPIRDFRLIKGKK